MTELWTALALVLVLEGAVYALFPEGMKRLTSKVATMPASALRTAGLTSAILGVAVVWLLRG